MKELSIEEKAKAYDEAIERARVWRDKSGMPRDRQGVLDDIFPELKESEDERIMGTFRDFAENYLFWEKSGLTKEKALAWLEKQGQKPAWSEEDENIKEDIILNLQENHKNKYINERTYLDEINWLKSLKERYTWKPSNKQMVAINTAINVLGKGTLNGKHLIELQEQLKKLKG